MALILLRNVKEEPGYLTRGELSRYLGAPANFEGNVRDDYGPRQGKARIWFGYGLALVAFYAAQAWLNYVFNLGTPVDLHTAFLQMAASQLPNAVLLFSIALNTLILGPFLGLIIAFGEEYGWRGFLQTELNKLGRMRGTFILGVIWGVWHWPIIWMGYNYPGQPVLGSIFMVAPTSVVYSFGIGLPALGLGASVVLLLLRDPVWKASQ